MLEHKLGLAIDSFVDIDDLPETKKVKLLNGKSQNWSVIKENDEEIWLV